MSSPRWISPLCCLLLWSGLHVHAHEVALPTDTPVAPRPPQVIPVKPIPADQDPEVAQAITAAITKAQETFPPIWVEIEKERRLLLPNITTSLVKGWFFSEDKGEDDKTAPGHYRWVTNFTYHPATKTFTGILATGIGNPPTPPLLDPEDTDSHTKPANPTKSTKLAGSPKQVSSKKLVNSKKLVSFPLVHLADWIVVRSKADEAATEETTQGAFMTQLLRSRMDREAKRAHDELFPFDFPEFQPQNQSPSENANQL